MAGERVAYKWSNDDDVQDGIVNGECIIDAEAGAVYVPVVHVTGKLGGECRIVDARNLVATSAAA